MLSIVVVMGFAPCVVESIPRHVLGRPESVRASPDTPHCEQHDAPMFHVKHRGIPLWAASASEIIRDLAGGLSCPVCSAATSSEPVGGADSREASSLGSARLPRGQFSRRFKIGERACGARVVGDDALLIAGCF